MATTPSKVWLVGPALLVFNLALVAFILASFFDWEIAVYFAQFFQRPFGNFLSYWASNSGNHMLFFSIVLSIALLVESHYLKAKNSAQDHWIKRNSWFIWFMYGLFFVIYISLSLVQICLRPTLDQGWGKGIAVNFVATYHRAMAYETGFFLFGLLFYSFVTWFVRFKLPQKSFFLTNAYWIDSLKILIFGIVIYLTVGIMKLVFSRPFYFSNIFNQQIIPELEKVPGAVNEGWTGVEAWQQLPYKEWWQPFEFINHMKTFFSGHFFTRRYNDDFPSGHMASCAIMFSLVYLGLDKPKGPKFPYMVAFSMFMWIQMLAIFFGMIIYRFHWMSDMCFTLLIAIIYFWGIQFLFKKKYTALLLARWQRPKQKKKIR